MSELYVKYRPQTCDDILGNDLAIKSIRSELENGHHVFLLTGESGTGKTTLARAVAKEIGGTDLSIHEINSSENRGIDTVREIMEEIRYQPLEGKSVYILDECFHQNTTIDTLRGRVKIKDIIPGEWVYNTDGIAQVKSLQKKKIPLDKCVILTTNYGQVLTTKEHLFYTKSGFVEAENLVKGDVLYDNQDMPNMWEGISDISVHQWKNLRKCLWYITTQTERIISEAERLIQANERKEQESFNLSSLWEEFYNPSKRPSEILFDILCSYWTKAYEGSIKDSEMRDLWKRIQSTTLSQQKDLFSKLSLCLDKLELYWKEMPREEEGTNEKKQSCFKSLSARKDKKYKDEEWNTSYLEWKAWRERSIHERADEVIQTAGGKLVSGVSNKNLQKITISNELQSGYRKSIFESCHRDRREWSQHSEVKDAGQKENRFIGSIRVEGIEVYKSRSESKSFCNYFTDTEYDQGYVELYDLEIYGSPTYYANGILVHNCHQQTSATQNAMLKMLEECPNWVYFFLVTTDSNKLLDAIKTRCSRIQLKPLDHNTMFGLLRKVAHKEQVTVSLDVLHKISDLSEGSSRKGLKLLGQVLYLGTDEERMKYLEENSFSDDNQDIIELCRALIGKQGWGKYAECIEKAKEDVKANPEGVKFLVMSYARTALSKCGDNVNIRAAAMIKAFCDVDTWRNKEYAIWEGLINFCELTGD